MQTINSPQAPAFQATGGIHTENEFDNRQAKRKKIRESTCNLSRQERAAKREQNQLSR